ncbi:MAG: hypothetical protein LIP05_05130 [Tannerellaceae bacterium]|nr:hypothetical protein [Tannerellaceae bacterium]
MKSTFSILFYLKKGKISKDGKATIMVRITIDGLETTFSSKQKVKPTMWNQDKQETKGYTDPEMQLINEVLTQLRHRILKEYNNLYDEHGFVEPAMIKEKLTDDSSRIKTLGYWCNKFFESYKNKVGHNTSKKPIPGIYLLKQGYSNLLNITTAKRMCM